MVAQRYRWDFIGLSTDTKPTKATSEKVTNGSTYYESDTSKLYIWYGSNWYERKPLGGGGGTSDFDQLTNRPKYNGTAMTGETNIPEVINTAFTGTDGTAAGTAGLVPAPATTDAGKFLKADGTWDTAGGSSAAVVLTSADNNYHSTGDTDDGIAVWKLDRGYYKVTGPAKVYWINSMTENIASGSSSVFIIGHDNYSSITGQRQVIRAGGRLNGDNTMLQGFYTWSVSSTGISTDYDPASRGGYFLSGRNVEQSTGESQTAIMSQKATTSMVYSDPSTKTQVKIGASSVGNGGVSIGKYAGGTSNYSVTIGSGPSNGYGPWSAGRGSIAIGEYAYISGGSGGVVRDYGIAIGANSRVDAGGHCEIALGAYSKATQQGQMDISTLATTNSYGYNNSQYRLLTGLYDPQSAHDAATKGYVDTAVAGAGGAFTELTSADYNYPDNNPTFVSLYDLEPGLYYRASSSVDVRIHHGSTMNTPNANTFLVLKGDTSYPKIIYLYSSNTGSSLNIGSALEAYKVWNTGGEAYPLFGVYDDLNPSSNYNMFALSAKQGKVLNDKITALEARVAALEGN